MYDSIQKPNSKGCLNNAYKMSYQDLKDEIENDGNITQILIGCDDDDEFYKESDEGRLKVYIETKEPKQMISFDLEDFLIEVEKKCPLLFKD